MRYIAELERKVQTLQSEATTLSAQLAMLQVLHLYSCTYLFLNFFYYGDVLDKCLHYNLQFGCYSESQLLCFMNSQQRF